MPSERTLANVRRQPRTPGDIMTEWTYYKCGCVDHDRGRWTLCTYHLGYDDACTEERQP